MKKIRKWYILAGCLCLITIVYGIYAWNAYTAGTQLEEILQNYAGSYEKQRIIVQDTSEEELKDIAEQIGAEYRMAEVGSTGVLYLPEEIDIEMLCRDIRFAGSVDRWVPDYYVEPAALHTPSMGMMETATMNTLSSSKAMAAATGKGISIAIIDSGIDMSSGHFDGRISENSYNAATGKLVSDYGMDVISAAGRTAAWAHGSYVAGIIAAAPTETSSYTGLAPEAELVIIQCPLNELNEFNSSDLVFGLAHAIACNVDIINMSFYVEAHTNPFAEYTQLAVDSDIICVAAAGNKGTSAPTWPAADENVISVGFVGSDLDVAFIVGDAPVGTNELSPWSNYGDNSDLVAPATYKLVETPGILMPVATNAGSTFSCAAVTGALALYLEKSGPYQEYSYVKQVLMASCKDSGELGDDWYYGAGLLDVDALVVEEKGTITFDYQTDEISKTKQVFVRNHTLQQVPEPEREYAVFDGWYYDAACNDEFDNLSEPLVVDITVYANWINEDDNLPYTYIVKADGTAEITGYVGKRRYLTVPSTIDGYTVTSIGEAAFRGNSKLRMISLPDSLREIDAEAFYRVVNLQSIEFPESLELVGAKAFYECSRLASVGVPAKGNLKEIGCEAFAYCGRLSRFDVPDKLERLFGDAFLSDLSMTTVTATGNNPNYWIENGGLYSWTVYGTGERKKTFIYYPSGLSGDCQVTGDTEELGAYSFAYSNVNKLELPEGLTVINAGAFTRSRLREIVLPGSLRDIPDQCFMDCIDLEKVTLGSEIEYIGREAFARCYSLSAFTIPENSSLKVIDDVAFSGCGGITSFAPFENSVTTIGERAFQGTGIQEVKLKEQIKAIDPYAFANSSVETVSIADDSVLEALPMGLFENCGNLHTINIPENIKQIGASCFAGTDLNNVLLHKKIEFVEYGAFLNCNNLTDIDVAAENRFYYSVNGVLYADTTLHTYPVGKENTTFTIPDEVTVVGDSAFRGSRNLREIIFGQNVEYLGQESFKYCDGLTELNFNPAMREVGLSAFEYCVNLTDINFNEGFETIGINAFAYNVLLPEVRFPSTLVSISRDAFLENWAMHNVYFAENSMIGTLDQGAFRCSGIEQIAIPESVRFMSLEVFDGCSFLKSVSFADNSRLESLSSWTFRGADNLERVEFGSNNSLKFIGARAFEYLPNLKEINLQDCTNLEEINNYAFQFCTSLTDIQLPESLLNIGRYAFYGCANLNELMIPANVEHIGRYAFAWCNDINIYFTSSSLPRYLDENWDYGIRGYCCGTTEILYSADGQWAYALLQDGTVSIQNYMGTAEILDITQIDGYSVSSVGSAAFRDNTYLREVTFPEGLCSIFNNAFEGTTVLERIRIPASVTHIGAHAFYNSGISELVFEDEIQLQHIEKYAFANTVNLQSVSIPASVTEIREYAFDHSGLTEVIFSEESALTVLGRNAFSQTNLTEVILPVTLEIVDYYAFADNQNLASVTFGEITPLMLYGYAFYNTGLQQVTIPTNVELIGEYCFAFCRSLCDITVSADNIAYSSVDGILMNKEGRKLITVPAGRTGSYEIPAGVSVLGFGAFEGSQLSEITIPEDSQLATIGYRAFYNVMALKTIHLPASLLSVDFYGFAYCENLESVTFAVDCHLSGIYEGAFYGCTKLREITLADEVKEIGKQAFYGCENLTNVTIGENNQLEYIDVSAFEYTGLQEILLPETVKVISDRAFANSNLVHFSAPANVESIGIGILDNVSQIESLTLPYLGIERPSAKYNGWDASLNYVFDSGFTGEDQDPVKIPKTLKNVHIQDMQYVAKKAFANYSAIETVTSDKLPVQIGDSAFNGCSSLRSFTGTEELKQIGMHAFQNCTSLTSFGNADKLLEIGERAFFECTSLETVGSLGSLTKIGEMAFYNCKALKGIDLPATVTELPKWVFSGCNNLAQVDFLRNITLMCEGAFSGCKSLQSLELTNLEEIPASAFADCAISGSISMPKVRTIGTSAFQGTTGLNGKIVLPDSLETIDGEVFRGSDISWINIPAKVKQVQSYTFYSCNKLETVELSEGLQTIGSSAFSGCKIRNLVLPTTITTIGENAFSAGVSDYLILNEGLQRIGDGAFSWCNAVFVPSTVTEITGAAFSTTNGVYFAADAPADTWTEGWDTNIGACVYGCTPRVDAEGSVYADYSEGTRLAYYGGSDTNLVLDVSDGKKIVAVDCSFKGRTDLLSVTFGDALTSISKSIFEDCSNLESVVFADNYSGTIPEKAFCNCTALKTMDLPDSLSGAIGQRAFYNCDSLTEIVIPGAVTELDNEAFFSCDNLRVIDLYSNYSLIRIGSYAIGACEELFIPETVATIEAYGVGGYKIFFEASLLPENLAENWKNSFAEIIFSWPRKILTDETTQLQYAVRNDGSGAVICGYNGTATELILDNVAGVPVGTIMSGVFKGNTKLQKVILGATVTEIEEDAFAGCTSLTAVQIVENCQLHTIGNKAFERCTALTEFQFENLSKLHSIGDRAFYECALTETNFCNALKSIGEAAFLGNDMASLLIPDSVVSCGSSVFQECVYLQNVKIGAGLKSLPIQAFSGCSILQSVELPVQMESIGSCAFGGCFFLTEMNTPAGIQSISSDSIPTEALTSRDGLLYFGDCLLGIDGDAPEKLVVPEGVRVIANDAFYNRKELKEVVLPAGVEVIGGGAFCDSGLEKITLPEDLKRIGSEVFSGVNITKLSLPEGLEHIEKSAFSGSFIQELTIPNTVIYMEPGALEGMVKLQKLTTPFVGCEPNDTRNLCHMFTTAEGRLFAYEVPESLRELVVTGDLEFIETDFCGYFPGGVSFNNYVESVIFLGNCTGPVQSEAFVRMGSLKNVILPEGCTEIGYNAFAYSGLEKIDIPDSVTEIGADSFFMCEALMGIDLPKNLVTLGSDAFRGCIGLQKLDVNCPQLQTIGNRAFEACESLEEMHIPDSVRTIGDYALGGCSTLKRVTLPDDLESLGKFILSGCNNLEYLSVWVSEELFDHLTGNDKFMKVACLFADSWSSADAFPQSLQTVVLRGEEIPEFALGKLSTVQEVIVETGAKTIGRYAFQNCTNLRKITLPEGLTYIGEEAFDDCIYLEYLLLPDSIKEIEDLGKCAIRTLTIPAGVTRLDQQSSSKLEKLHLKCPLSVVHTNLLDNCTSFKELILSDASTPMHLKNVSTIILDETVQAMAEGFLKNVSGATIYCYRDENISGWPENWANNNIVYYKGNWRYVMFQVDGAVVKSSINHLGGVIQLPAASVRNKAADSENSYTFLGWDINQDGAMDDLLVSAPMGVLTADAVYAVTRLADIVHITDPEVSQSDNVLSVNGGELDGLSKLTVAISADTVGRMNGKKTIVDTGLATVAFDTAASTAISEAGQSVTFAMESVDANYLHMAGEGDQIYDLNLTSNGDAVSFGEGTATITVPCYVVPAEGETLSVYHVTENGVETEVSAQYNVETGEITFQTSHFSLYRVATSEVKTGLKSVMRIEIAQLPTKLQYAVGSEQLDLSGGMIAVFYNDHSMEQMMITEEMVSGFDNETEGSQRITVTWQGQETDFEIMVASVPVSGVVLDPEYVTLTQIGDMFRLTAAVIPENATNRTIIWNSENTNIAQVDENGVVIAIGYGSVKITATTRDGNYTASCVVFLHDHRGLLTNVEAKVATCEEPGNVEYWVCECGKLFADSDAEREILDITQIQIAAEGHWVVTDEEVQATCIAIGRTEGSHCERCGEIFVAQEKVPALGHLIVTDEAIVPECTKAGLTEGCHCSRCLETFVEQKTIPALGHQWDEGMTILEPTVDSTGVILYSCERCGETREAEIPTLDHVHRYESAVTDPACTEQGYTTYTCACGDSYVDDETAALGHNFENGICVTCGAYQLGDVDKNGIINDADAIYLIWHTLFPREYLLDENLADFNGDREVTDSDAVALLWFALGLENELK